MRLSPMTPPRCNNTFFFKGNVYNIRHKKINHINLKVEIFYSWSCSPVEKGVVLVLKKVLDMTHLMVYSYKIFLVHSCTLFYSNNIRVYSVHFSLFTVLDFQRHLCLYAICRPHRHLPHGRPLLTAWNNYGKI